LSEVHVIFLLDYSGSMATVRDSTVKVFNEQVQKIKDNAASTGIDTYVSLYKFNHLPGEVFFEEPVELLNEMTLGEYEPRGGTALFDTMIDAIEKIGNVVGVENTDLIEQCADIMNGKDSTVLFIVISDGEDLNSRSGSKVRLVEMIQRFTGTGCWTFTYMGANQNLQKICEDLGFEQGNVSSFSQNIVGMAQASVDMSRGLDMYYSSRSSGVGAASLKGMLFYNSNNITKNDDDEQTT
jgi:hypothetical protein